MTARNLRVVRPERIDITALMRAEIRARDWDAVHIAADRRSPIYLPEFVRRVWRG